MKEHFYIIRAYEKDGLRQFQIAGDMDDARFSEGTIWNEDSGQWESAYDDDENEENDLQIADALANAINDLKIKLETA
jgi:hypothetical protein